MDTEREPGFYWIKVYDREGDGRSWTPADWDGDSWSAKFAYPDEAICYEHLILEVGPRILPPEE